MATGTPTSGYFIKSAGTGVAATWVALTGANVGITVGRDCDRPAASSTTNIYFASDTFQTYITDQTSWYNSATGWDKVTVGRTTGGMGDTWYLQGPPAVNSGPTFANPYTICLGFWVVSLPGAVVGVMCGYGVGNPGTNGWYIASSGVNANKLALKMVGVNSSAVNELSSMTALTTGFHVVCVNYDGSSFRYVVDGGTVNSVAASGAATALSASSFPMIGRWTGATGAGASWMEAGFWLGYASALSDADMQTLSSLSGTTFKPGAISANPAYNWQASFWRDGEYGATAVNSLTAYGTASNALTYLTPNGTGGGIKTRR